jgi:hypothetical protein
VQNLTRVDVLETSDQLREIAADLDFGQPLPPLQQLLQGLILAHLQQNIHVGCVFEVVFESDDVGMGEGSVQVDFRDELRGSRGKRK